MESARYFCQILIQHEFSRQILEKSSIIKFHKNPSFGGQAVPCGQADITKIIVALRDFAKYSHKWKK
jgi:hypothetical protein